MDGFELNKIAGAVLASLLALLGLNKVTGAVYAPHGIETAAYTIEGVEETPGPGGAGEPAAEPEIPLATLLASATVEGGERVAKQCISCHSFEKGGPNKTGPNLFAIVGSSFAHLDGYGYSNALKEAKAAGRVWSFEELNGYLENPKKYLPGNKMSFAGLRRAEQRADMIVYLRQYADSPVPLPAPPPPVAAEPAGEAPPAPGPAGEVPAAPADAATPG